MIIVRIGRCWHLGNVSSCSAEVTANLPAVLWQHWVTPVPQTLLSSSSLQPSAVGC